MARRGQVDPLRYRRRVLLGVWLLSGAAVLGRAGQVQILQGAEWQQLADAQHQQVQRLPAPRGAILDREGIPLVETREQYEVGVDSEGLGSEARVELADSLVTVLGISLKRAQRAVDAGGWHVVGRFSPEAYGRLRGLPGVFLTPILDREYPQGRMALGILGRIDSGVGVDGIEKIYDEVLRGEDGEAIRGKRSSGGGFSAQVFQRRPARPGGSVTLTLDGDLQTIAREAMEAQVDTTEATGGDLIAVDVRTGALLAAVSLKDGVDMGLTFSTEPVEPGSTMKPFTLAALLEHRRASLDDEFDTGDGIRKSCGEVMRDTKPHGVISLARAVEVSSNVAMAQAVETLDPLDHWATLRDFGFGQKTGVPLSEAAGTLKRPDQWTCPSQSALAIGYEIDATPLQMAMAYGALANGGVLMEPRLVKEIRHADGRVEEVGPRVVRRVVSRRTARAVTEVLVGVVEEGTGGAARLHSFKVAGKTGTARVHRVGSGYDNGTYYASFVGYLPADDPQLVIYAKLDNVDRYGGAVAAPVIQATMEAALAASASISRVLTRQADAPPPASASPIRPAVAGFTPAPVRERPSLAEEPDRAGAWAPTRPTLELQVPDLEGTSIREAARRLHALGLRVRVSGTGTVQATRPGPGSLVETGDTILLRSGRADR